MPLDTPHEIEDDWNWMKHDWMEGVEEDLARLCGINDEEQLQQLRDFDVYEEMPRAAAQGHKVISTRWVQDTFRSSMQAR
jgi:hypothetical protein